MNLGPESKRPTKLKVKKNKKGVFEQVRVPFTDEEWQEYLEREKAHQDYIAEYEKTEYLRLREDAYQQEIYPELDKARLKESLEGDETMIVALRRKKEEIDARYPAPV